MKNTKPVRQHTVPKTYLKHFTSHENNILVFHKTKNEIRKQDIRKVSVVKNIYAYTKPNTDEKAYDLEEIFGELIEVDYNFLIKEILKKEYVSYEKECMSYFIAAQSLRSPRNKKQIINEIKQAIEKGKNGELFKNDYLNIFKFEVLNKDTNEVVTNISLEKARNYNITVNVNKDCYVQYLIMRIRDLSQVLKKQRWVLLIAKEGEKFLTCDNPLVKSKSFYGIEGDVFPLTQNLCLILGNDEGTLYINSEDVRKINKWIIENGDEFVFLNHKDQLKC
ncbi:DUF4238 domain-containing protein [Bacillus subtilis]|uniref:DUF4238 domain-containing protein n=1 Tax=Bacillus subtilis TaxID=1423 RepID=UPI00119B8EC7|nr:DUF4238 domain-containing protein [Bacillus subtilis]TWG61141.1 uncharacterized protein DUF4238 [Bacillus subtilis J24]TWG69427.1 uncharacterized protein DUF4238 [Bacillus subtilis J26]